MKNKSIFLGIILSLTLAITACGKDESTKELDTYKASMSTFCENVAYLDKQLNKLDGKGSNDVSKMLSLLDQLEDQFQQMSELDVPEQFANVDELADEAAENMNMAVTYYHEAYEGEQFNHNYIDAADEYYSRANLRLNYIIKLLHGDKITDDSVIYTEIEE